MLTRAYCWARTTLASEEGATAVEYGIMVTLIAVAIILSVTGVGLALNGTFGKVAAAMP